jgi:hypothetical protein
MNIESQGISGWSRTWALEFGIQLLLEVIQGLPVVVGEELLVHMNRENEEIVSSAAVVGAWRWARPWGLCHLSKALFKHRLRRLLESVEGLPQKKDLVCWNIATFRWGEVDCFLKIAIEESRFDVDLVAFQIEVIDQRDEDPDGVSVGNRCKELIEVDAFNLRASLGDTSSLIIGWLACIPSS